MKNVTIGATIWDVLSWEELDSMDCLADSSTTGLMRIDDDGAVWTAMQVDGFWSCAAYKDGYCIEDAFGDSAEEAARALIGKRRAKLNATERAVGLSRSIVRAIEWNLEDAVKGRQSYEKALQNAYGKAEELMRDFGATIGRMDEEQG